MLVLVFFSGCTLVQPKPDIKQSQFEIWLEEKEYGRLIESLTLATADKNAPNHSALISKLKRIKKLAKKMEVDALATARRSRQKNQWQKAFDALNYALNKIPDSEPLETELEDLKRDQNITLRRLEFELLIIRTQQRIDELELRERINEVNLGKFFSSLTVRGLTRDLDQHGRRLAEDGEAAFENGELDLAESAIRLSLRIRETAERTSILKRIEKRRTQINELVRKSREREELNKKRKLQSKYIGRAKSGLKNGQLTSARRHIEKALAIGITSTQGVKLKQEIEKIITSRVASLSLDASTLYRAGHFREAKDTWEAVLVLEPRHPQARINLDRVQRVLNNLKLIEAQNASQTAND